MRTCAHQRPGSQRGQAMAEFLLALAVLLPLFLAVSYLGRYGDILQTTVQASRYAAFQRAMQPNTSLLSDATLQDQMRARFFVDGDYLNGGKLQSNDSAVSIGDKGTPPMWRDLALNPLVKAPTEATLSFGSAALNSGAIAKSMDFMSKSAGKSWTPATVARVEVVLAKTLDQTAAKGAQLSIGAATAAAGNGLGSSGSKMTRDAAATLVPTSKIPSVVSGVLTYAMELFEPTKLELGCIKPDVVPNSRLDPYVGPGACQ